MGLFLSLFIIFGGGILGGFLFEKIHLPKLIWYLVLGILIGPSLWNIADPTLISISSYLRQIALVIILTRSGLSLNLSELKKVGRPAILLCFVPATLEIVGVAIFGPLLLGISLSEALLLGAVLAAVSPAVVVPRMIRLMERGYGAKHHIPDIVMAGASADDVYVIVLFYSFKGLVATSSLDGWSIAQIPISIVSGIALGLLIGIPVALLARKWKPNRILVTIFLFAMSFGMIALENVLKPYFAVSSLLGILVMALVFFRIAPNEAKQTKGCYDALWPGFEMLLFALVGIAVDARYAFSSTGAVVLGLIAIGLCFRSLGVLLSVSFTPLTKKERVFVLVAYVPKATVQASIGAIALSEGLACGAIVLTGAVVAILFTAPLGAILMDALHKKLLDIDGETQNTSPSARSPKD